MVQLVLKAELLVTFSIQARSFIAEGTSNTNDVQGTAQRFHEQAEAAASGHHEKPATFSLPALLGHRAFSAGLQL
uniref:Secreted protein n=1 Tax=Pyxicephalus adspersus TaxID=30357 RepID=A0AAV3A8T9_PYXAD|nr:TPA: hypothetical protein GDO54_016573 [Pyxicephalus adspersus]